MTPGLYRHFKGGLYRVIGRGEHTETKQEVIVYQTVATGELWVRPAFMWDEQQVLWPDGQWRPRFVPEGTGVPGDPEAMPDDNKFQKLRTVGYSIPGLCIYCKHSKFDGPKADDGWGTCSLHQYQHLKHDNPTAGRGVSIHVTGTCPNFEWDEARVAKSGLGAHLEFLQRK
jgi:hypothetical protein